MPTRRARRATSVRIAARDRVGYLLKRIAVMLRNARTAAGLAQTEVALNAGVSQAFWSKLERGVAPAVTLETLAACGAAVGLRLAAFFEEAAGATLPRDMEHLVRQNLVVEQATPGGWAPDPEALLRNDGPRPRSIDVLLVRAARKEAAVTEIWDLIDDGGAVMRGLDAKVAATRERLGPSWHVEGLLLVRATHRKRALVAQLNALWAAKYPASSAGWLRALRDKDTPMPSASGFAWTSVKGDRLFAARLR